MASNSDVESAIAQFNTSMDGQKTMTPEQIDELKRMFQTNLGRFGEPALNGLQIPMCARDDARFVGMCRVDDIASGVLPMPFCHARFFAETYTPEKYGVLGERFQAVMDLSLLRNVKIMQRVNVILENKNKTRPDGGS